MKDTDLYSKILGVEDPWHVDHVDISVENQSIRVYLKHDDKVEWRCPLCNKVSPVYDHREEREWRHLDSCQFKTILVASLPRINCPKHGIHTIDVPWSNLNSRFTLLFEAFAIDVLGLAKVQVAAARLLRLSPSQVHSIMCRAVARGLSERDSTESITHVTLDEKSFKHKHQYVTLLGDPEGERILDVAETRTQKATENLLRNSLSLKQMEGIQAVTLDMWQAFIGAVKKILPHADTVHDRFHIAKYLSEAVDKTRRDENRQFIKEKNYVLKNTKYLWLTSPENLTAEKRKDLEIQIQLETETSRVWSFKDNFRHFFEFDKIKDAYDFFRNWYQAAAALGNRHLTKVAEMLRDHLNGLLAYIEHRVTNSYAEAENSKIQILKASARGYHKFENFRIAILFHFGKLDLYPHKCS